MKYIVKYTFQYTTKREEYIADGRPYTVNQCRYVPFTESQAEARRYKTRAGAIKAAEQDCENTHAPYEIIEVEEQSE